MRLFILRTFYFLLPLLVLSFPIDYIISHSLRQSNQYPGEYEVWNDIYSKKAECDIAIYGSSRAWVQINPQILSDSLSKSVYNFGIDGHNFWIQYLRHLELIKYNNKPTQIILSVDLFSLQKRSDLYQSDQFLPYMLWNEPIKKYTSSYIGFNTADYYIPLLRYAGKRSALSTSLKMLLKPNSPKKYRNHGFLGMDIQWNSDFENFKAKKEIYTIEIDESTVDLFQRFIQECKDLEIELILIYTPEYIEGQNSVSNRNELIDFYKEISKQYELKFYDYSNDEICLNKQLFYNATHLNKQGAEVFSQKLAKKLMAETMDTD